MFTFFLKTLWVATATDAQPVVVTAESTFKFIGYPSLCCVGSCSHPCPRSSAECCLVTHPCCKLPHVEDKHSESWKPYTKRTRTRGLHEGLAEFKQPGFGNFGSQQEDSLITWAVDPGAFQAQLFELSLFSSKTIFLDGWGGPTQGLPSGPSATLWPHMIWKTVAIAYWKEALPTYSHRLPFLLQSH